MKFRMACLILLIAGAAQATHPDSMKQCNQFHSTCTGDEDLVWTFSPEPSDLVRVFWDYDIHEGGVNFCEAIWFATYNSEQLQFVGTKAMNHQASETVLCYNYEEPPSLYCPECDTLLACIWYKPGNQRPVVTVAAEIEVTFRALKPGTAYVYADEWYSYGHSFWFGTDCSVEITGGQTAYPHVAIPVPEPGSRAFFFAGLPFVAWLGKRRARKRRPTEAELEAAADDSRQLITSPDECARLAEIKSQLDQSL